MKNVCSAEQPLLKSLQYCTEIERCHCVYTDAQWRAWWCHMNSLSLGRVQRRLGWDYLLRIPSQQIYMPRRDTTDIRPMEELCEVQKCTNWSSLLFHILLVTSCFMDLFLWLGVRGYNHRLYLLIPSAGRNLQIPSAKSERIETCFGMNLRSLKHSDFAGRSVWKNLKFHQLSLYNELYQIKVLKMFLKKTKWKSCCWKAGGLQGR